ncbi:hypothetical protein LKV13_00510 [Borrelia sp. BU AG58]|uniref:hypothetical protein n=1 Tax=Borrelia sp. BU AG58 TaxID=2887345 RepID=UPI001E501DE2|nr:hypothetical protein [Borrelia sp. BU AG58]UER67313.1 hypothetical protein LKV13_00510 [Borrelia sp. BU AG58]
MEFFCIVLLSSSLALFSEESKDKLRLSSDVERELSGSKSDKDGEDASINQSARVRYPRSVKGQSQDMGLKKISIEDGRVLSYSKKNRSTKVGANSIIEIRQSERILYPRDSMHMREGGSGKNTEVWYKIKVYPKYNSDRFEKIKKINAINSEMRTRVNKDFALIGPVLEDDLGTITKTLATKGYDDLEYIKIE